VLLLFSLAAHKLCANFFFSCTLLKHQASSLALSTLSCGKFTSPASLHSQSTSGSSSRAAHVILYSSPHVLLSEWCSHFILLHFTFRLPPASYCVLLLKNCTKCTGTDVVLDEL
jgi:hypothetical protein